MAKKSNKPQNKRPQSKTDDTMLLGSSVQPSIFKLKDGSELQLGDIVRRAYEDSGVSSAREWNKLEEELMEAFIQKQVDALDLAEEDVKEPEVTVKPDPKTEPKTPAEESRKNKREKQEAEAKERIEKKKRDDAFAASKAVEDAKKEPPVWVWALNINFGKHKPGDLYKGEDHKALAAKGWIKQK